MGNKIMFRCCSKVKPSGCMSQPARAANTLLDKQATHTCMFLAMLLRTRLVATAFRAVRTSPQPARRASKLS